MAADTFRNPVHGDALADPFVLKHKGRYWAYGTPAEGPIPVLTSTDLVSWERAGTALEVPPASSAYWAPEVAYDNGAFFLYYSVGGHEGEGHQVRVATATAPAGPFVPRSTVLDADDPFTIDAHPFRDDDGTWYLFYSRDFTDGERVGTGIVVDRLVDMTTLAGERAVVVRPHADWHVYERQRRWYGRVWDWYTLEGPSVRKHDGRYWCFFSGGAWRAENYGVTCAVADHPMGPFVPRPAGEGADILRTVAGEVVGPGHASVVTAPDNVTDYLAYHAWDPGLTGRYMRLDFLDWTPDGPSSPGPTTTPQALPPEPDVRLLFGGPRRPLGPPEWRVGGRWEAGEGEAVQCDAARREAAATLLATPAGDALVEVNVALRDGAERGSAYGIALEGAGAAEGEGGDRRVAVEIVPGAGVLRRRSWERGRQVGEETLAALRPDFIPAAFHQILLRRHGESVTVSLDGCPAGVVRARPGAVALWADRAAAAFAGVAVTALSPRD